MKRTEAGKLASRPTEKSGHHHPGDGLYQILEEFSGLRSRAAQSGALVVGSIIFLTGVSLVAGKPLISACLRMIASSLAR